MTGLTIVLALLIALLLVITAKGTGRNREGTVEWRFGRGGVTRFGTYDSPMYPNNRAERRAIARGDRLA